MAAEGAASNCPNGATSQNSLEDRKSISSHRYSSVNLGTVNFALEISAGKILEDLEN